MIGITAKAPETRGPIKLETLLAILAMVDRGNEVPVWKYGFKDWISASEVPELAKAFATAPPPIQPSSSAPLVAPTDPLATNSFKSSAIKKAGSAMAGTAGVGLYVAWLAVGVLQIGAFIEGMELYFKLGSILSIIIFFVVYNIPLGSFAVAFFAYYGARYGWRWEWWQALALAVPGILLTLFFWAIGGATLGLTSLLQRRAR